MNLQLILALFLILTGAISCSNQTEELLPCKEGELLSGGICIPIGPTDSGINPGLDSETASPDAAPDDSASADTAAASDTLNGDAISYDPPDLSGNWVENCNYFDDPHCWSCTQSNMGVYCIQTYPDYPDGNPNNWVCYDEGGLRICNNSSADAPPANSNWNCSVSAEGTTCTRNDPDLPDSNYQWDCYDDMAGRHCQFSLCQYGNVVGVACSPLTQSPASGATVTATVNPYCYENGTVTTTADPEGNFFFSDVPVGMATVTVNSDGVDETYIITITAEDDAIVYDRNCTSCQTGNIRGPACNAAEKNWMASGTASIDLPAGCGQEGGTVSVPISEEGQFEISDVPAGIYEVTITNDNGYSRVEVVIVAAGETVTIGGNEVCLCNYGTISGRVCSPEQRLFLNDATVYIDLPAACGQAEKRVETTTDSAGYFTLTDIPDGQYTLHVVKGSFTKDYEIPLTGGQNFVIPEDQLCLNQARIAVVIGDYDQVETVLTGLALNYTPFHDNKTNPAENVEDLLAGDFATNPTHRLKDFDIVFLNCGDLAFENYHLNVTTIKNNLRNFLAAGGSVYTSDYAFTIFNTVFTDYLTAEKIGKNMTIANAAITDNSLETFLGTDAVEINYDLISWVLVTQMNREIPVHVQGDALDFANITYPDSPLLVSVRLGVGKMIFTTFHQDANITDDMVNILRWLVFEL